MFHPDENENTILKEQARSACSLRIAFKDLDCKAVQILKHYKELARRANSLLRLKDPHEISGDTNKDVHPHRREA
jgi:hypothetical protein